MAHVDLSEQLATLIVHFLEDVECHWGSVTNVVGGVVQLVADADHDDYDYDYHHDCYHYHDYNLLHRVQVEYASSEDVDRA